MVGNWDGRILGGDRRICQDANKDRPEQLVLVAVFGCPRRYQVTKVDHGAARPAGHLAVDGLLRQASRGADRVAPHVPQEDVDRRSCHPRTPRVVGAAKEISTVASGSGTSRRKSLSMASSMKWITPVAPVTDLNAAAQLLRLAAFSMLRLFCGGR